MPRKPLGYLEVGNTSASRVRRALCKPNKHHGECKSGFAESTAQFVDVERGCAEATYWRARVRVGMKSGEKPVPLEAVARTQGLAKESLKQRIDKFVEDQSGKPRRAKPVASGLTLAAAMDKWLQSHTQKGGITATTRERYERVIRHIIAPEVGSLDVTEVTKSELRKFLDGIPIYDEENDKTYRVSYVKPAYYILNATFKIAAVDDLIESNPMFQLSPEPAPPNAHRTAAKPLTPAQYRSLRGAIAAQPRIAPYFLNLIDLLAGTGMRISEALALTRANVATALDADNPHITLDSRLQVLNAGVQVEEGLKESRYRADGTRVNTSRVIVHPPRSVVRAIAAQLALDPNGKPDDLLFRNRHGKVLLPANIRRTLREASEAAGLGAVSPHSFRKMVAEAIRAADNDSGEGAAEFLGNTPSVVAKHYLQPTVRTTSAKSAAIIEDALSEALEEAS